jgi:hypothetical protein
VKLNNHDKLPSHSNPVKTKRNKRLQRLVMLIIFISVIFSLRVSLVTLLDETNKTNLGFSWTSFSKNGGTP